MKKKYNDLIKYLSNQNKPLTSTEISNALDISSRSVKNYVGDINALYHNKIILSSRNGYTINPKISLNLLLNENEDNIPQTNEDRSFYIIKQLILEHTSHLDLYDLCDDLCISYSSVKNIISKMNKTFSSYHISFICENDSVYVEGSEKDKRKLLSYIIFEESKNSFIDTRQLRQCFTSFDIDELIQLVTDTFKTYNFYLNDFASVNLLLHLAIIIDRELSGNILESNAVHHEIVNESEQEFITYLCNQLEEKFNIHLNQHERFEIYMLFKANANYSLPSTQEELQASVGEEIIELINYYVEQINNLYMIDLSNSAFTTPFSLHLKNLLFRASTGRFTNNPMAETIKMNSPIVFDIAIYIGLDLMERYKFTLNEDEMAFLAMHIGAEIERQNQNRSKAPAILLCPDYRNMCLSILNKLLMNFGNQLTINKTFHSEEELKELDTSYNQILFTTLPIHDTYNNLTIVEIPPFNIESKYDSIQEALFEMQNDYQNHKLRTNFHNFFFKDLFITNPSMDGRNQIITCLCDKLKLLNYVDESFEEKVYKRENAATTAFGNIAIPHSVNMDAIKTSIAVAISKKGIRWGTNTVHLVLLLAINKADKKTFRELYESLISIFSEDSVLQEIKNCTSFEDFESLIYNCIDDKRF
ncbi:BglG family transcription antiterminator [Amedibacterium intestinale]|uniref:BglG family transcription antiterminator n=1 Tax=Amedibacterium intestinale TaxID=2583452 RepID=UPI003993E3B6